MFEKAAKKYVGKIINKQSTVDFKSTELKSLNHYLKKDSIFFYYL